jgi:hypothetical protein
MKKYCGFALLLILNTAGSQVADTTLRALDAVDHQAIACGCLFKQSLGESSEGGYGSGPEVLVIAPNVNPPYALVNFGNGNLRLSPAKPIVFPMYQCTSGSEYRSQWIAEGIRLFARLSAVRQGGEACWFSGSVVVESKSGGSEAQVKGACGC